MHWEENLYLIVESIVPQRAVIIVVNKSVMFSAPVSIQYDKECWLLTLCPCLVAVIAAAKQWSHLLSWDIFC